MCALPSASTTALETERKKIVNRLRRLAGQVRGVAAMIEADKECESILTQVMATRSALDQVWVHVIGHAMKTCLIDDSVSGRDALVSAAFDVYLRYRDLGLCPEPAEMIDHTSVTPLVEQLRTLESKLLAVETAITTDACCEDALRELTEAGALLSEIGLAVLGRAMHRCLIDDGRPLATRLPIRRYRCSCAIRPVSGRSAPYSVSLRASARVPSRPHRERPRSVRSSRRPRTSQ